MKHLIVFPGLSSPYNTKYIPVYDLLREKCKSHNIELEIIVYPGQKNKNGIFYDKLSPNLAIDHCIKIISRYERNCISFSTLGISFGCNISLSASLKISENKYWKRIILWGPVAQWRMWRSFCYNNLYKDLGKDTTYGIPPSDFYNQIIPIEHLITATNKPITVGIGSLDQYSEKEYLLYLRRIAKGNPNKNNIFTYINNCSHNVSMSDPNYSEYISIIFKHFLNQQQSTLEQTP